MKLDISIWTSLLKSNFEKVHMIVWGWQDSSSAPLEIITQGIVYELMATFVTVKN